LSDLAGVEQYIPERVIHIGGNADKTDAILRLADHRAIVHGDKVVVVEQYKELGGRASTFHQEVDGKKLQWEAGAGRISENHHEWR
jgi:hypothetical protein